MILVILVGDPDDALANFESGAVEAFHFFSESGDGAVDGGSGDLWVVDEVDDSFCRPLAEMVEVDDLLDDRVVVEFVGFEAFA